MATRSPLTTPRDFRAFANRFTSRSSIPNVNTRESPGSPSQIMAALFRRAECACRSTQLYVTFSFAPTNHLAHGAFHSRTFCHGANQSRCFASSAQQASGSFVARCLNSFEGGNVRRSSSRASRLFSLGNDISADSAMRVGHEAAFKQNHAP